MFVVFKVCQAAVGLVGDLCRALGSQIDSFIDQNLEETFCDGIMKTMVIALSVSTLP